MAGNPTVVFTAARRATIRDDDVPRPGPGEVLIETAATLISTGTELTVFSGDMEPGSAWTDYGSFPFVPGYDNVGTVVDAGPGVARDFVGKTVGTYGSHAAYVTAAADSARIVPAGVSASDATFFTIAEIVLNAVRRGGVKLGESVAVYGLGLLGQLTVRFCRLAGARPVFAIDASPERLSFLQDDQSVVPVNPADEDPRDAVSRATRGRLADVVFEVTGDAGLLPKEFRVLRRQGRLVVLGCPRTKTPFDFHDLCNSPSYTIVGAHNSSHPAHPSGDNPWTNLRHAELFFDLVADGAIDVERLITHTEPYTEAPRLYGELLEDRARFMGVILLWPGGAGER
jgi:2-desacetyl-2-hydroxyethyl bacteriochlorophyllide A dehydrogenase